MSAHRIYCYAPQLAAAASFMEDMGAIVTPDAPHPVSEAVQLRGLEHITFITIDNHPQPIPQPMWEVIVTQGAIVIHVDDQYRRSRAALRIPIKHYPGENRDSQDTAAAAH